MKSYSKNDILKSLKNIGVKKGDLVFVNSEIYKLGVLDNSTNINIYDIFFKSLKKIS